ncbi:MAG: signal peptidase I [Clostridia bacterium]|nr:signal peptidase I [Clostridia bacterium]
MTGSEQRIARVIAKRRDQVLARQETWALVRRVLLLAVIAFAALTQVFLITQVDGQEMFPAVKDGDLALVYRLQRSYMRGDVVAYEVNGQMRFGRIAGMPGDEVAISTNGTLLVNGLIQSGEILFPTEPRNGEAFTCSVPDGCYYILGDYRTQAEDSRDFGPVPAQDMTGKLITILRRRGL